MPRRAAGPLLAVLVLAPSAAAGTFAGKAAVELEYLGENYRATVDLPPLPDVDDAGDRLVDTTRFSEETWLPGPRLDLEWRDAPADGPALTVRSSTQAHRERFAQDVAVETAPVGGGKGWRLSARGAFREEEASPFGRGDWRAALVARREFAIGGLGAGLETGWTHSRTRGDTTSFVYDWDRVHARASVRDEGREWLPRWEAALEGAWKAIPGDLAGGYAELRAEGRWRPGRGAATDFELGATWRDYARDDDVGRDFLEADLDARLEILSGAAFALLLDVETSAADYRGDDDLYYDFAEVTVSLPVERVRGGWMLDAGPRARALRDLSGGDRDFLQGSLHGEIGRAIGGGGIAQIAVEAGYRDYRGDGGGTVDLNVLSVTFLRSDYRLLNAFVLLDVPLGGSVAVEALGDATLEDHVHEEERILVAFATLALTRSF